MDEGSGSIISLANDYWIVLFYLNLLSLASCHFYFFMYIYTMVCKHISFKFYFQYKLFGFQLCLLKQKQFLRNLSDVNLQIFCKRLKRVLLGEEGKLTLPDSTKLILIFHNLLTESEIITTSPGDYQCDMVWLLYQLWYKEDADRLDILGIQKGINYFVQGI